MAAKRNKDKNFDRTLKRLIVKMEDEADDESKIELVQ